MPKDSWKFEWITDWDTIYSDSFQQFWLEFIENAHEPHVFFHPALCMAWLDTYRPIRNLDPWFCIARNGETTVFFPMVLWRRNWKNAFQRLLVPVGYSDFDYHDPLVIGYSVHSTQSFFRDLREDILSKIRFDNIHLDGLREKQLSHFKRIQETPCPYINLNEYQNFDEYWKSLAPKLQKNLTRRTKKLRQLGDLEYTIFTIDDREKVTCTLSKMRIHHKRRWPKSYQDENFLSNVVGRTLNCGILHFSVLSINDVEISWRFNYQFNKVYYSYLPAVDYEFDIYSLGKIHLLRCIEYAFSTNFEKYDEMRGPEAYKNEWCNQHTTIYDHTSAHSRPISSFKNMAVELKNRLA